MGGPMIIIWISILNRIIGQPMSAILPNVMPPFTYIKDLAHHGAKTAEVVYGCKGWTAHTTANVWGYTPIQHDYLGLFSYGRLMDCFSSLDKYEFTQDKQYLAETAYPLFER